MEVKHVNQETKNSWKQASTNYHKLLDYVHRRGSLSYIVYMSKVINNKNLSEDLKTIDVHFHSLKNIEVARLELAIEKIKKFYDAGEVTNDYNKLVDAITKSNKVSNISLDQKEILQKAISNYAKKLGLLMTEYDAVIESVRKYPTMAELEASKEAKQITLADTNNELTA